MVGRRRFGGLVGIVLACIAFAPRQARAIFTDPIAPGSIKVKWTPFVTIPSADGPAQDLIASGDGTGRVFVATRNGRVRVVDSAGNLSPTTFLNMGSGGAGLSIFTAGEGGFAGLAFSPNYLSNGKFFTLTTETYSGSNAVDFSHPEMLPAAGGITPSNHIVIREWTAINPANATAANTTSRVLMRINHPQNNHQGGALKIGPDGDLYIGLGDGGGGNDFNGTQGGLDGHSNTAGNGQDTNVVFGKILRIDPNGTNSTNGQYGVPADNPFVGQANKVAEIFAYGMRNPYRFSFDSVTQKLLVGDVGQDSREEVDNITNGGNYGWPYREGSNTNSNWTAPGGFTSIAPIAEYRNHTSGSPTGGGNSVIGGFVYRGTRLSQLVGKYVFGDLSGGPNSSGTTNQVGRLFYTDSNGGGSIFEFQYDLTGGGTSPVGINAQLWGFGEDANHELYAMFSNGQILQMVPEPGSVGLLVTGLVIAGSRRRRAGR